MHCYTTMETVISTSVHCPSSKGTSLIISRLQRWSLSLNKPKIHHSIHKISLINPITSKLGLLDTFKISLLKIKFIIPFLFRLSSVLRSPIRMLRTLLTSIMLVSCITYLCNLRAQSKQGTRKHSASNINFQTRQYGALLRPTPCFHLLLSTNVSQSQISIDADLFYMLTADE